MSLSLMTSSSSTGHGISRSLSLRVQEGSQDDLDSPQERGIDRYNRLQVSGGAEEQLSA